MEIFSLTLYFKSEAERDAFKPPVSAVPDPTAAKAGKKK
jgi:hypothetical protein